MSTLVLVDPRRPSFPSWGRPVPLEIPTTSNWERKKALLVDFARKRSWTSPCFAIHKRGNRGCGMAWPAETWNLQLDAGQEDGERDQTVSRNRPSESARNGEEGHVWPEKWVSDVQPPPYAVPKPKKSEQGSGPIPVGGLLSLQSANHVGKVKEDVLPMGKVQKHRALYGKEDPMSEKADPEMHLERKVAWIMLISRFVEGTFALVSFIVMANSNNFASIPSFQAVVAAGVIAFVGCTALACTEWLVIGFSYDETRVALTMRLVLILTYVNFTYDGIVGFLCLGCCCAAAGILTSSLEAETLCKGDNCRTETVATVFSFFTAFILIASLCLSFWKYRRYWMKGVLHQQLASDQDGGETELTWTHSFGLRVLVRSMQVAFSTTAVGIYISMERRSEVSALQFALAVSLICLVCSLCLLILDGYCLSNKLNGYPNWFGEHLFIVLMLLYDIILCCLSLASASATSGAFFGDCSLLNLGCSVLSAGLAMSWLLWLTFIASFGMSWRDFEKSAKVSLALKTKLEKDSVDPITPS